MQDLRFALRQFVKSPGFTCIAILTLALGIGANTAIFSVINSALLRPLAYPEPERLVQVWTKNNANGNRRPFVSGPQFKQWREHSTTLANIGGIHDRMAYNLIGDGIAERVTGAEVTANYLDVLGVHPVLGRGFQKGEDVLGGENRVVILSYEWWRNRFGADPAIIDRTINFNQQSYTVVGILPPRSMARERTNFLVPLVLESSAWRMDPATTWLDATARLHPGVSVAQADGELNAITAELHARILPQDKFLGNEVRPMHNQLVEGLRPTLVMLLGAVGLVLLIACANVANLLLARATTRQKEMAVRVALGATTGRIVRQVMTESLVLSLCGGALGILVTMFGVRFLTRMTAGDLPAMMQPELDWQVLVFSLLLAMGTGILFGILPALQASRTDVNSNLKEAGRGSTSGSRSRPQSLLIISEVAFTVVLLIGAGLMLRSFTRVLQADPGFNPRQTLVGDMSLTDGKIPNEEALLQFHRELVRRIQEVPGVAAVGTATTLPLGQNTWGARVGLSETPVAEHNLGSQLDFIGGDYFRAMDMSLRQGRPLNERDNEPDAPRVVVINEQLAATLLRGTNPLGRRIHFNDADWEIVGVVGNVRHRQIDAAAPSRIYAAHWFSPHTLCFVVRTTVSPLSLVEDIRRAVASLDPDHAVANFRTLEQAVSQSLEARRLTLYLLGSFAVVAIALASLGVYSVMAYSISQRERELSIRMALGAQRQDVMRLVLRDGLRLGVIGIVVGLLGGLAGSQLIASRLYEVSAHDPLVFVLAAMIIALVAVFSVLLPARRATRFDAIHALRAD